MAAEAAETSAAIRTPVAVETRAVIPILAAGAEMRAAIPMRAAGAEMRAEIPTPAVAVEMPVGTPTQVAAGAMPAAIPTAAAVTHGAARRNHQVSPRHQVEAMRARTPETGAVDVETPETSMASEITARWWPRDMSPRISASTTTRSKDS